MKNNLSFRLGISVTGAHHVLTKYPVHLAPHRAQDLTIWYDKTPS